MLPFKLPSSWITTSLEKVLSQGVSDQIFITVIKSVIFFNPSFTHRSNSIKKGAQGQIWSHQKIPSPWFSIGWFRSPRQAFVMVNISCKFENSAYYCLFCSSGGNRKITAHCFMTEKEMSVVAIFFQNEAKYFHSQDFMMNIPLQIWDLYL